MANLSTAFGTITITSKNKPALDNFITKVIKPLGENYYDLTLDNELGYSLSAEGHCYDGSWTGTGRWAMIDTLSDFKSLVADKASPEYLEELKNLDDELVLELSFVDEEGGCDVLYSADMTVTFGHGEVKESISDTDYPRTYENLVNLGFDPESYKYLIEDEEEEEEEEELAVICL